MAKFNRGDRVDFNGKKGTVVYAREGNGMPVAYKIKGDDGETYTPPEYALKYVGNSRSINSITSSDEKKMCDVMRRYLNNPGDKIVAKVHEGLPNGMTRTTVEVYAAYQDDERESPHYRIKAAKKAVMDALTIPCVGDGTRTMNDGSVAGYLIFMNSRVCNSRNPVVIKAMNATRYVRIDRDFSGGFVITDGNSANPLTRLHFDTEQEARKYAAEHGIKVVN